MRVLRENRADARAGGIRCDIEELVKVWKLKDRSGRQGNLKLLEGAFGAWIPVKWGMPEYVYQRRGDGTEFADETSIKLSQAVETPDVENRSGCWPMSNGCSFDGIHSDSGRRDDEPQE